MANVTTTISSVGVTRSVNLDWANGAPTTAAVTGSSSGTFGYTLQYTLSDVMQTPAASVVWINDPQATALSANSSAAFLYQQPIAGLRLSASAISGAVLTLQVNQGSWL